MKKKIVHLTSLSKNIKFKKFENFYAGKWCDIYNRNSKIFLKYKKNNKKLEFYQKNNISFLAKKLNNYHKVNFSNKFWNIVLYPWVASFSHNLYDRYLTINKLINLKNVDYFLVRNKNLDKQVFDNYLDFVSSIYTDEFNNQIFFYLLKILSPKKIKFFKKEKNFKFRMQNYNKNVNYKKYLSLFCNKKVVFFDSQLPLKKYFKLYLKYFFYNNSEKLVKNDSLDLNFRDQYIKDNSQNKFNFQTILNNLAIKYLPKSYLENFNFYNSKKMLNELSPSPKVVVTSISHICDDMFKIWYGNVKEKNKKTKLFVLQHGSEYLLRSENITDLSYNLCDKKLNWGSVGLNKKKDIFLGANFSFEDKKILNKKIKILYVCNEFPIYNFKGHSVNSGPNFIDHILLQENFLKNLNKKVKKKIEIKPYPFNYGWNFIERIKKIDKKFKIIKEKNIGKIYKDYDLIVSATPQTTFLESIYFNIPSITLFEQDTWKLNSKAKNIFSKLKKRNIYFDHPIKAANYINRNLASLKKKWHSKDTQKILNIFRENYIKRNNYTSSRISNIIERSL